MRALSDVTAIVFDYGNTLVEFTQTQIAACDEALGDCLARLYGPVDVERLKALRDHDRRAAYDGEYREQDMAVISTQLVRNLVGREPSAAEVAAILRARYEAFVAAVEAPDYLHELLETLSDRFPLALLSNYPDGAAIRASLRKLDLDRFFAAVVVSGDVGRVKPHPRTFEAVLGALGTSPRATLHVGDNWLGDIQGAKRAGLRAALMRQWDTPEKFDRRPGDLDPDLVLDHLTEILDHVPAPDALERTP